jgi:hypothetical protein
MGELALVVVGVLLTLVVEHGGRGIYQRMRRSFTLRRLRRKDRSLAQRGEMIRVKQEPIFIAQHHSAGIDPARMQTVLRPYRSPRELVPTARLLGADVEEDAEAQVAEQRLRLEAAADAWNGSSLALRELDIAREGPFEEPALTLTFEPSEHAAAQAFAQLWRASGVDHESLSGDMLRTVCPAFSHTFGLNATVESADGQVLLTRRGARTRQQQGRLHISVNEGMRPDDLDERGNPDPLRALLRGCHEELGLSIPPEQVTMHTLVLDVTRYEWALLGHVDLRGTHWTLPRIRAQRSLGAAPDDWETDQLVPVTFHPDHVLRWLGQRGDWVPHGAVNLGLSAAHRFPRHAERLRDALLGL